MLKLCKKNLTYTFARARFDQMTVKKNLTLHEKRAGFANCSNEMKTDSRQPQEQCLLPAGWLWNLQMSKDQKPITQTTRMFQCSFNSVTVRLIEANFGQVMPDELLLR
jgi:hypothetical protein